MFDTGTGSNTTSGTKASSIGIPSSSAVHHTYMVTPDAVEQRLTEVEAEIARLRAESVRLLRHADVMQLPAVDGARSLQEWAAGRLDLSPEVARDLADAARALPDHLEQQLAEGDVTFCRAVATSRLTAAGAPDHVIHQSGGHDISGVRRLTAAHKRLDPGDEQAVFDARHATLQLSLDQTSARMWAQLSGTDSQVVRDALHEWADRMPPLPGGNRDSLAHRQADALVAIFQHALDSLPTDSGLPADNGANHHGPHLLLTGDLGTLAASGGTAGARVVAGPRIGLNALEEALCNGTVSLDVRLEDGRILGLGAATDVIPPRVRRHVLARDGGCTAAGCRSRYRLQVHHIQPRSQGGSHDPANLTVLCWYHHHVVVHGMGYDIDPHSPPQRRRFLRPANADPP